MGRVLHAIEKGLRIFQENSSTVFVDHLLGSGVPPGTSGETDAAPKGSIYSDITNGKVYYKKTATSSAADWSAMGDVTLDQLHWRNEKVLAATGDSFAVGVTTVASWSDNDGSVIAADFSNGDYVIVDVDGVPALRIVTNTGPGTITLSAASQPIADNDTFVVQHYLPDSPASQEGQAIVHIPVAGSPAVKIGDVNWNFADGINLPAGYASGNGTISNADTVNSALQKLDGNQQDIQTASGIAQGSTNYGAWTSPVDLLLSATATAKALFQRLGDLLMQLRGVQVTGLTTLATVDSVPHATVKTCKWLVEAFEVATPANRVAVEVFALTDGTSVDDTTYAKLKLGTGNIVSFSVDISGADMRLRASSGTAGVTVTARRIEVVKSVL